MGRHFGDTTRIQSCVDRWLAGDESARNELLERSQRRLHQLAAKMLRGFPCVASKVQTDDVVSEANYRLLRALQQVQPRSAAEFIGLAARQIRWQLLDWAKKYNPQVHGEKPSPDGTYLPIDPPDSAAGPATLAEWAGFHELISHLEPEKRLLFDLLYYGDLTQAEAAAALGISPNTLRRRWVAAALWVSTKWNK